MSTIGQNTTVHLRHSSQEKQAHWSGPGTFWKSGSLKRWKKENVNATMQTHAGISATWKRVTCT